MSYQNQLPVVPENSVVTTWRQQAQAHSLQQPGLQACFVARLAGELLLSRTDNMNLRQLNKQLQHDAGCWRQEYEQVLVQYWKISEHNATLLGQVSRLKEQLRAARSRKDGPKTRRNSAAAPVPTESHHPNMVNDSDGGSRVGEANVKQEIHANLE
ncbi:hypothetical protein CEP54_000276 [Fusarium duplospermum]|uniref:Uncharacterized protein n=1 Tax=Fusarium duplospermum TaxID=1325734 RepID=A0A428R8P2_9HYPO|nr:hypothetical protein CEP54_000276 [Fusarium duplospermum]